MTPTPGAQQYTTDPRPGTPAPVIPDRTLPGPSRPRPGAVAPRYDYEHYSRLAGPLTEPEPGGPYRVQYPGRPCATARPRGRRRCRG